MLTYWIPTMRMIQLRGNMILNMFNIWLIVDSSQFFNTYLHCYVGIMIETKIHALSIIMKGLYLFLLILSIAFGKYSYFDKCYRFFEKSSSLSTLFMEIITIRKNLFPVLCQQKGYSPLSWHNQLWVFTGRTHPICTVLLSVMVNMVNNW